MSRNLALRTSRLFRRYYASQVSKVADNLLWKAENHKRRVEELVKHAKGASEGSLDALYPRLNRNVAANSKVKHSESSSGSGVTASLEVVTGKVTSVRKHGGKLAFIDVTRGGVTQQVMVNYGKLGLPEDTGRSEWKSFLKALGIGDFYTFRGTFVETSTGETALEVTELPQVLAPSLHDAPTHIDNYNVSSRFPQIELVSEHKRKAIELRDTMEANLAHYLRADRFLKVTTPILAAHSGGAAAKPFETVSNAQRATGYKLFLRIAQELELKKMIVAGYDRVYEIGQVFRNEGIDATHNPEFITCEIYEAYADLHTLKKRVENIFAKQWAPLCNISSVADPLRVGDQGFATLEFIPTLEKLIREKVDSSYSLPNVLNSDTWKELVVLFKPLGLPTETIGQRPTTGHVLDVLSSKLIEPLCTAPTFITHYPSIMTPLAKSFICPDRGIELAAQAELFINGTEYANLYEEENNPFAQARKFLLQAINAPATAHSKPSSFSGITAADIARMPHEEVFGHLSASQKYYVRVMEMGMPPTGGIGIGIDRAVMLFSGSERISDVLPFGNLRSVIAMGD